MSQVLGVLLGVFHWIFAQGAPVIVPVTVLILGAVFRAPLRRTLLCALRMGVGFTALYALITIVLGALGPTGELMAQRYGIGLTVPDVGWPVLSSLVFALPYSMAAIAGLFLLNAVFVAIGVVDTLNVDYFNHWPFIFTMGAVQLATGNWILAIISALVFWFITLKMADWTYPYIEPYYEMPGISIPHSHSVVYAPLGFLMDRIWDHIPKIRDIKLDPTRIRERYGLIGEPIFIGTIVGLIIGILSYVTWPPTGDQLAKVISLALTLGFFMVILPRCSELIVMGLAPLAESIREFITRRMPGREFHLGLDVAVLVGKPEHVALGVLLAPLCYLIALLIPGNRVLPLADAAGYMIFFTVWGVNTCRGNLFRGLLNSLLLWIPISLIIANAWVPATMTMVTATGFKLPVAAPQVTSLTTGSHFIGYALYQIMAFLGGGGSVNGFIIGLAILIVFGLVWFTVRARPKAYAEELKEEGV